MRNFFFLLAVIVNFSGYAQQNDAPIAPVKLELRIKYKKELIEAGVPGTTGILIRNETDSLRFITDSTGQFILHPGDSNNFFQPNCHYEILIQEKYWPYAISGSKFSTNGIVKNTILLREIRSARVCSLNRPSGIIFPTDGDIREALRREIETWWFEIFDSYPAMTFGIVGYYDRDDQVETAWQKTRLIQTLLMEFGIAQARMILEVEKRPDTAGNDSSSQLPKKENPDVFFRIYSL